MGPAALWLPPVQPHPAQVPLAHLLFLLHIRTVPPNELGEVHLVRVELGPVDCTRTPPCRLPSAGIPHIPVPSTMIGLTLAKVFTPHSRVSSAAARIIGIGPIT